jgi:hypothetical protein
MRHKCSTKHGSYAKLQNKDDEKDRELFGNA